MRAPFYLMCATLVVSIQSEETSGGNSYFNRGQLEPVNMAADQETISYLLPKLAAKYRPSSEWTGVTDPRFYLLTEMEPNEYDNQDKNVKKTRSKRFHAVDEAPSLSINAPIQALRKAYAMERMRERLRFNRQFLDNLSDSQ